MSAGFKRLGALLLIVVMLLSAVACGTVDDDTSTDTTTTDTVNTTDTDDTTNDTDDTDSTDTDDTTQDTVDTTDTTDTTDTSDTIDTTDSTDDVGKTDETVFWGPYEFAEGQPDIRWITFKNGIIDAYDENKQQLLRLTTSIDVVEVDFDPFVVEDMDFDGDKDLRMLYNMGAANAYYLCWLWNGERFTFYEDFAFICSPYVNEYKQCVASWNRENAANYCYSEYEWINGELLLTFRADIDYNALMITYAWFDENGELVDMNSQEYESIEDMYEVDIEN